MLTLFRYYFNYFIKNNRYNSKITVTRFDDVVGTEIPEMNLGRLDGWLEGEARRSILRKVHAEACGPATRCENGRSKIQK